MEQLKVESSCQSQLRRPEACGGTGGSNAAAAVSGPWKAPSPCSRAVSCWVREHRDLLSKQLGHACGSQGPVRPPWRAEPRGRVGGDAGQRGLGPAWPLREQQRGGRDTTLALSSGQTGPVSGRPPSGRAAVGVARGTAPDAPARPPPPRTGGASGDWPHPAAANGSQPRVVSPGVPSRGPPGTNPRTRSRSSGSAGGESGHRTYIPNTSPGFMG